MPKTILVTGCAGFIGSNFIKQFSRESASRRTIIIGLDDFSTGRMDRIKEIKKEIKQFHFYKGSILDQKFLDKVFKKHKPEFVFHFAALPRVSYSVEHPLETTLVNIGGTVSVLEASKKYKAKRVVFSSSSAVYGGAKKMPTKESENFPDPKSPYAAQKFACEPLCKIFSELFGLDTVCLRYFNVFGPGQYGDSAYSTVVSAWLEGLYFPKNKKAFIEGDGEQSRDFCYVDNVVQANILAMKFNKKFNGEVFNVAHGERITVNETKRLIEKYTGKKLNLEKRPSRAGDVLHTQADISKAGEWLGYKPKIKFEEGLKKTIQWFQERN